MVSKNQISNWYRGGLGREPDSSGLNWWHDQIQTQIRDNGWDANKGFSAFMNAARGNNENINSSYSPGNPRYYYTTGPNSASYNTPGGGRQTVAGSNALGELQDTYGTLPIRDDGGAAERDNLSGIRDRISSRADNYLNQAQGLNISDYNQFDSIQSGISSTLDQANEWGFGAYTGALQSADRRIDTLRDDYSRENQRVSRFQNELSSRADDLFNRASSLDLSDYGSFNRLQSDIGYQLNRGQGFTSQLDFDFGNSLNRLQNAQNTVGGLMDQYDQERDRVNQARNQFQQDYSNLSNQISGADVGNLSNLQSFDDAINNLSGEISNFSSPINPDFGGLASSVNNLNRTVDSLYDRREREIDRISNRIPQQLAGLDNLPLSSESEFNRRREGLEDIASDLSNYQGGVGDIRTQLEDATAQVDSRLQELSQYRDELAAQAQQIQQQSQERAYYGLGELEEDETRVSDLQSEAQTYEAQRALEQIESVMARLQEERTRLEADQEAVANREAVAQSRLSGVIGAQGVPQFSNPGAWSSRITNRVTLPDASQLPSTAVGTDDDEGANVRQSIAGINPFSSSLGVIRVG